MVPEPGRPFFFYTPDEWGRHPHYGRFLKLEQDRLVEMTWMTHSGHASEKSRDGHAENWPLALEELEKALS